MIERVNISCFIYSNMPLDKCAVFTDFEREKILFDVVECDCGEHE